MAEPMVSISRAIFQIWADTIRIASPDTTPPEEMIGLVVAALAVPMKHDAHKALSLSQNAKVVAKANDCGWTFDYTLYANSMTADIYVTLDGSGVKEGAVLGAFIDGKLHGLSSGMAGPPFGAIAGEWYFPVRMHAQAAWLHNEHTQPAHP